MRLTWLTGRHRSTCWKVLRRHGVSRQRRSATTPRSLIKTCAADHVPLPDIARLHEELARARRRGYVLNVDFQPGRVSVAAPVVDAHQVVLGGVSVAGPATLFDANTVEQAAADIVGVAAAVSERIGVR